MYVLLLSCLPDHSGRCTLVATWTDSVNRFIVPIWFSQWIQCFTWISSVIYDFYTKTNQHRPLGSLPLEDVLCNSGLWCWAIDLLTVSTHLLRERFWGGGEDRRDQYLLYDCQRQTIQLSILILDWRHWLKIKLSTFHEYFPIKIILSENDHQ